MVMSSTALKWFVKSWRKSIRKKLHGTLIAIPVVNVFGFIHKSRYLPDRRDLNRSFPGSERGSIAGRMAYQLFDQVIRQCSHVIDLHTAAIHRTNLPQIRANLDNQDAAAMATAFGAPVVVDAALREGSLRAEAERIGIPVITYEAGEALRFEPYAINAGVRGVIRVMRDLGMLRQTRRKNALSTRYGTIDKMGASRSRWVIEKSCCTWRKCQQRSSDWHYQRSCRRDRNRNQSPAKWYRHWSAHPPCGE